MQSELIMFLKEMYGVLKPADSYHHIQGWIKKWAPGLVNFVPDAAYHFCLNLPEKFLQPGPTFKPALYTFPVSLTKMMFILIRNNCNKFHLIVFERCH